MNKVITINLNGRAFQVEEAGYAKLRSYLDEASERLADDPDKSEIIADLEQAIAEKLDRFLSPGKNVVTDSEIDGVIAEMGPVESSTAPEAEKRQEKKERARGKRLYKIREQAMISGVCAGLAAYFKIDVVLMRIIFVLLAIVTHGGWVVVYIVLAVVLPPAKTGEEKAAAYGEPFTAQEFVNRAREEYTRFANRDDWRKWKHDFKRKLRQEKYEWKKNYYRNFRPLVGTPFLGLLTAVLTLIWLFGMFTIIAHATVLGWAIPASIPLWIAILGWLCLYGFVVWPIKAARYRSYYPEMWYYHRRHGFFEAVIWLAFLVIVGWAVWHYAPGSHIYFERALDWWQHFVATISRGG